MSEAPRQNLSYEQEHSITALEFHLQIQHDEFTGAESKAQSHINTSAVVIAILGVFTLSQDVGVIEVILLAILIIAFVFVFTLSMLALSPRVMYRAIPIDEKKFKEWKELIDKWGSEEYRNQMFKLYHAALVENQKTLQQKIKNANLARYGVYVELIVALLLLLRLIKPS